jgi:plasmid segregation protein ParM
MLLGLDIGFGFSKTVTRFGADAFPSVVADWTPADVQIGGFDRSDLEALAYQGRQYLVGERALKVGRRLFVGLSREWFGTVPYRLLVLNAIRRRVPQSSLPVTVVTGLPVGDIPQHLVTVKRQLVGTHRLEVLPAGRTWEVTIADARVIPQPLGTVFSQVMDDEGNLTDARLVEMRIGVLDVGFRTSDYFTLQGFEVIPAQCLTRNTGIAELLLDVSREVSSRYGVETDPHALNDVVLRKMLAVGARTADISGIVDPLLDRHAEAILAHGRMLWGDEARDLQVLWMTGGGAQLLGARLKELAPHATLVTNARIQNAVGFYRFGCHLGKQARR